jgi:hypothetical protein
MENLELTIAIGAAVLIYKSVRIAVWQRDLDSPFTFEFSLDGKTTRRKTKTKSLYTVARHARTRVDQELGKRRHETSVKRKIRLGETEADSKVIGTGTASKKGVTSAVQIPILRPCADRRPTEWGCT